MMTMKPCTTHPARTGLQVGQRYGLPVIAPVDDAGVFTEEAGPVAGLDAMTDGSKKVVDLLRDAGAMLKVCAILSSAPVHLAAMLQDWAVA